ncbi:hypothetical protein [Ferrovibrio sp.]|uniref:hypothetical protein n=1 Tax=Ferrovibrio sp. TaxID=1917215 RepID=UPI003D0B338F
MTVDELMFLLEGRPVKTEILVLLPGKPHRVTRIRELRYRRDRQRTSRGITRLVGTVFVILDDRTIPLAAYQLRRSRRVTG